MQTTKTGLFTPAPVLFACRYSFDMLTHLCNVLSKDFVEKSGFECFFWSAQCIETPAKTSENVKTWVFISINVQFFNSLDSFVYCNTLHSIEAAFLELEKAMFIGATLVPTFTIITPGPYTQSEQSKAFHAKCNLKVNCDKKRVWSPEVIVWMLQISIKQTGI